MTSHLALIARESIVYGFLILDPVTKETPIDYVGQSVQTLSARERQHRGPEWDTDPREQPWSDLIVGKPVVLERGVWTAAELDEREQAWIRKLQPRYNDMHNRDNPHRITRDEARRQREARDAARGVVTPTWDRPAVRPQTVRRNARSLSPSEWKRLAVVGTWVGLSAAGWWAASTYVGLVGWRAPLAGAVAAVVLMFATVLFVAEVRSWWGSRRARRQRRRLARRVTALVVAAGVVGLLWLAVPHLLPLLLVARAR